VQLLQQELHHLAKAPGHHHEDHLKEVTDAFASDVHEIHELLVGAAGPVQSQLLQDVGVGGHGNLAELGRLDRKREVPAKRKHDVAAFKNDPRRHLAGHTAQTASALAAFASVSVATDPAVEEVSAEALATEPEPNALQIWIPIVVTICLIACFFICCCRSRGGSKAEEGSEPIIVGQDELAEVWMLTSQRVVSDDSSR